MDDQHSFGIELELTASGHVSLDEVACTISQRANLDVRALGTYYKGTTEYWKLVSDSSIACSRSDPNCTKFELVSPVLKGGDGLNTCYHVLHEGLPACPGGIKVNKSMGFHVHIDVHDIQDDLVALKKICQNFVKFEAAIDSFMPPSRRAANKYCQSHRNIIDAEYDGNYGSIKEFRHQRIGGCESVGELSDVINPDNSRYFKLNLQNIISGKQPTIEFRQHSATFEHAKIKNWIRFCMAFVHTTARLAPPRCFNDDTSVEEEFERLFQYVVKDRFLRDYYRSRRRYLTSSSGQTAHNGCQEYCDECTNGDDSFTGQPQRHHTAVAPVNYF